MTPVTDIATLEAIYGDAVPGALTKVSRQLTPLTRQWIDASRFVILSTVGPDGTDGSPRGDDGPVVRIVDDRTILMPDWRGNNRIDTLRNIVADGRISLMFCVPGCKNVLRVNGTAIVTVDPDVTSGFEQRGKHPRSVIAITVGEVYPQCAKALMRSRLWDSGDESDRVPTIGELIRERDALFDADDYDTHYEDRAQDRMW